jgi:predicted ATP-grasp superfamily ATP-dependent carboligase
MENRPARIAELEHHLPLAGTSAAAVEAVREPCTWSAALTSVVETVPMCRLDPPTPSSVMWLAKPLASGGGRNIRLIADLDEGRLPDRAAYYQQFVEGSPSSAVYIGDGQQAWLIGATRQWIGDPALCSGRYSYCGSLGPLVLSRHEHHDLARIGNHLAQEFTLRGWFGVDWIRNEAGVWPCEVNPRYVASIEVLELGYELAIAKWHLQSCGHSHLGSPAAVGWPCGLGDASRVTQLVGKAVVYWLRPRPLVVSPAFTDWALARSSERRRCWLADIPRGGSTIDPGAPLCTVLARRGAGLDDALDALQADLRSVAIAVRGVCAAFSGD